MAESIEIQQQLPQDLTGFVMTGCVTNQGLTLNLKIHKKQHDTGEKSIHCGICGLGFDSKKRLFNHVNIHKTEKPYECDVCGKCFTKLESHTEHMKTHTEEETFKCDVCEKSIITQPYHKARSENTGAQVNNNANDVGQTTCTCSHESSKQNNIPSFQVGDSVKIDGKGHAVVTKIIPKGSGIFYEVKVEMPSDRLTLIPKTVTKPTKNNNAKTDNLPTRFPHVSENEITDFIQENQNKNKNTESKTFYDMKTLQSFFDEVNEKRKMHEIPVSQLSSLLCRFFISARKPNGSHYEPSTLRSMMASFDRQLRLYNYGHLINTSPELANVRKVLVSKQKMLKKEGLGNLNNKCDPINDEEVDILWSSGQFGGNSPNSILQTLWFYNTVYFGLRGSVEHRNMCWGDITLHTDNNGPEYLSFNERQTTESNPWDNQVVKPKLWANVSNPKKCPVLIYKLYAEKRPSSYNSKTDPFYLASATKLFPCAEEQWFQRQPVGINKLGSMMSRMVRCAGIKTSKRLSNHSVRKYLVQKQIGHSTPANQTMQVSGHKNMSLNNDSNTIENQHRQISSILRSESSHDRSHISATVTSAGANNMFTLQSAASTSAQGFQSRNIKVENNTETNQPPSKRFRPLIESDFH